MEKAVVIQKMVMHRGIRLHLAPSKFTQFPVHDQKKKRIIGG